MKLFFLEGLADYWGHPDITRRHAFLMLYLKNGSVFTVSAEDDSGGCFHTHLFRLGHSLPHRRWMTLIPIDPYTHIACTKSSIVVDLQSFCGFQCVDPEKLTKKSFRDPAGSLSERANGDPTTQKTDPEVGYNVLSERMEISEPTIVIPFEKIKKITIMPPKEK